MSIRGGSSGGLARLINGKCDSTNEGDIWLTSIASAMPMPTIVVVVPPHSRPQRLRVRRAATGAALALRGDLCDLCRHQQHIPTHTQCRLSNLSPFPGYQLTPRPAPSASSASVPVNSRTGGRA